MSSSRTAMNGGELRCLNCGASYEMTLPAPLSVMTAAMKAFAKSHDACKPSAAGDAKMKFATPEEWLRSWDTGESSKTIWNTMMGRASARSSHPWDPDDFGRCHRLLAAFPAWRARLREMWYVDGWKKFVDEWAILERLYEEELPSGSAPKLFAAMKRCYP